jgi:hypothetical protein
VIKQRKISKLIPFVRQANGDYECVHKGVSYDVIKSTTGWGLSVFDRDKGAILFPNFVSAGNIGIAGAWLGTQANCVRQAETIWRQLWWREAR